MKKLKHKLLYAIHSVKIYFIGAMQYKAWFLAYTFQLFFTTTIMYYIWSAIAKSSSMQNPNELTTYIILAGFISAMTNINPDFIQHIRDGDFVTRLIKPYNIFIREVYDIIGGFIIYSIIMVIPAFIMSLLFFDLIPPQSISSLLGFTLLVFSGMLVMLAFGIFFSMGAFLTTNIWGLVQLRGFIVIFFSGALVPLTFFPSTLKNIANMLPFRTVVSMPVEYYLNPSSSLLIETLLLQAIWIVINTLLAMTIWTFVIKKKLTVNGG